MMEPHRCAMKPINPEKDIVLVGRVNEYLEGIKHQAEDWCGKSKIHRAKMKELYPEAFAMSDEEAKKLSLDPGWKILQDKMTPEEKREIKRVQFEREQMVERFWFELKETYPVVDECKRAIYLRRGNNGGYAVCHFNDAQWTEPLRKLMKLVDVDVPEGEDPRKHMPKIILAQPKAENRKEFYDLIYQLKKLEMDMQEYLSEGDTDEDDD